MKFIVPLLYFLILANLNLYGVNDIFDKDTDLINPKKRSKENLLTSGQTGYLKMSIFLGLLFSFVIFYLSNNIIHQSIFILFIALSIFYSAPPLRLKSIPFLDSLSNVLYGLPAVWGYMQNSAELPPVSIWILLFSWNAAMHLFSAIPDIKADKKAKIQTTAVLLEKNGSLILCTFLWGIFSITTIYKGYLSPFNYLTLIYPLLPLTLLLKNDLRIRNVYWYFPYINGVAGFLLFWAITYKKLL